MERTTVAVDLAKSVFQVAVSRRPGKTDETRRLRRSQFAAFFAQFPRSLVLMEACGSSSFWGRKLEGMGHEVVLLPPSQVHPYVRRNKTDSADAKALPEAHRNEAIRPVPIKSIAQHTLATLHRGLKRHLGHISKRGDRYLRMLLVHGARSALFASRRRDQPERLRAWALATEKRVGFKKAAVALANKLARFINSDWLPLARISSWPGAKALQIERPKIRLLSAPSSAQEPRSPLGTTLCPNHSLPLTEGSR